MAKSVLQKNWYDLVAPDIFDNEEVGQTPAEKDSMVGNRQIKVSLQDVMPSSDKYYMDVFLQVKDIDGNKAKTELVGHEVSKEYISKMINRRTDRIDHVFDVEAKDGGDIKVKLVAVTIKKANSSAITSIRNKMEELVDEKASKLGTEEFMEQIFNNEMQREINSECKKIYPLKTVEFRKTEITPPGQLDGS